MSIVIDLRRRRIKTVKDTIDEIHRQFAEALNSSKKAYGCRLYAGELLNDLRRRHSAGELGSDSWWDWYKENFVRSRKDAEKVMRLAAADDPEAAHEDEKAKDRKRKQHQRGADVRSNDPIDHILHLVDQLDAQQRQRFLAEIRRRYQ